MINRFNLVYDNCGFSITVTLRNYNTFAMRTSTHNFMQSSITELITNLQEQNQRLSTKLKDMTAMYNLMSQSLASMSAQSENKPMDDDRSKQNMEVIERKYILREDCIKNEIRILKQQLKELFDAHSQAQSKLMEKIEENRKLRQENQRFSQRINELENQKAIIQQQSRKREESIITDFNAKINRLESIFEAEIEQRDSEIEELVKKIEYLTEFSARCEEEHLKVKEMLNTEINKRSIREIEHSCQIQRLEMQIKKLKETCSKLKNQINDRVKEQMNKDEKLLSMEKTCKEMSQRVRKIENEAKKKVLHQKMVAKKAVDGLKIMKQYSEDELAKSRTKEKLHIKNQKMLISKIKEVSKQNSMITATMSSRKGSMNNLSTILPERQNKKSLSPIVSKFIVEEDEKINLQSDSHDKEFLFHSKSASRLKKHLIKTEKNLGIGETECLTAGTPSFEYSQNISLFKAVK